MFKKGILYSIVVYLYAYVSYAQDCKIHHFSQIQATSEQQLFSKGYTFHKMALPSSTQLRDYVRHIPPGDFGFNIIQHSETVNQVVLLMRDPLDERGVFEFDPKALFNLSNMGAMNTIAESFPACSELKSEEKRIRQHAMLSEDLKITAEFMKASAEEDISVESLKRILSQTKHKNLGELVIEIEFLLTDEAEINNWYEELKKRKERYSFFLEQVRKTDFQNSGSQRDFEKLRKFLIEGLINKFCIKNGYMNGYFNLLNSCGSCTAQSALFFSLGYDLSLKAFEDRIWAVQDFLDHRRIVFYDQKNDQSYDLTYGGTPSDINTGPLYRRGHFFWLILKDALRKKPNLILEIKKWFTNKIPEKYFEIRKEQHGFNIASYARSFSGGDAPNNLTNSLYQDTKGFTYFGDGSVPEEAELKYLTPEELESFIDNEDGEGSMGENESDSSVGLIKVLQDYLSNLNEDMKVEDLNDKKLKELEDLLKSLSKEDLENLLFSNEDIKNNELVKDLDDLNINDALEMLKRRGKSYFDQNEFQDLKEEITTNYRKLLEKENALREENSSIFKIISEKVESFFSSLSGEEVEALKNGDKSVLSESDIDEALKEAISKALTETEDIIDLPHDELLNALTKHVGVLYDEEASIVSDVAASSQSQSNFTIWTRSLGNSSNYRDILRKKMLQIADALNKEESLLIKKNIDNPSRLAEVLNKILVSNDYLNQFYDGEIKGRFLVFAPLPAGESEDLTVLREEQKRFDNFQLSKTDVVIFQSRITMPEAELAVYSALSNKDRYKYIQEHVEKEIDEIFDSSKFEVLENILLRKIDFVSLIKEEKDGILEYISKIESLSWNKKDFTKIYGSNFYTEDVNTSELKRSWPGSKYAYSEMRIGNTMALVNINKLKRIQYAALQYGKYYAEVDPVAELRRLEEFDDQKLFDFLYFQSYLNNIYYTFFSVHDPTPEAADEFVIGLSLFGTDYSIEEITHYADPMKALMANIFYYEDALITMSPSEDERKIIVEHKKDEDEDNKIEAIEEGAVDDEVSSQGDEVKVEDLEFELVDDGEFRQHFERIDRLRSLNKREEIYFKPEIFAYLFILQDEMTLRNPVFQLLTYRMWRNALTEYITEKFPLNPNLNGDLSSLVSSYTDIWRTSPLITHEKGILDIPKIDADSIKDCLAGTLGALLDWNCFLSANVPREVVLSSWINENPFVKDAYKWYLRIKPEFTSQVSKFIVYDRATGTEKLVEMLTPFAPKNLQEVFTLGAPEFDSIVMEQMQFTTVENKACTPFQGSYSLFPEDRSFKSSFLFNQLSECEIELGLNDPESFMTVNITSNIKGLANRTVKLQGEKPALHAKQDVIRNSVGVISSVTSLEHSLLFIEQGVLLESYPVMLNSPVQNVEALPDQLTVNPYFLKK